jgi:hypothetical protein
VVLVVMVVTCKCVKVIDDIEVVVTGANEMVVGLLLLLTWQCGNRDS